MARVLVADDSIAVRKVAERLLIGAGLDVTLAANAEEALAWLANERPDVVVTDVIMPDKSGYDVCNFVRLQPALSGTPVLLISGIVNDEVNKQAESCRADGVLKKPFQGTSLQDRVLELLQKREEPPAAPAVEAAPVAAAEVPVETPVAAQADASAPVTPPARVEPTAPVEAPAPAAPLVATKVYKITEEQLQSFRQASAKIKELEGQLAEEQNRSAGLAQQLLGQEDQQRRLASLEAALSEAQGQAQAAAQQSALADQAGSRRRARLRWPPNRHRNFWRPKRGSASWKGF
jgi:CheY-like chemotaxis protein